MCRFRGFPAAVSFTTGAVRNTGQPRSEADDMKSIIYDVDGTLWDSSEYVAESWRQVLRAHDIPCGFLTAERLGSEFGKLLTEIADSLFPELPPAARYELVGECCENENRFLLEKRQPLFDGVSETLKAIHALGVPQVIVSNSQKGYIETLIRIHGLESCVEGYLQAGDTGLPKNENIRIARDRWQLPDPVYVGDTRGDADAARKAGVPFVYAAYGFGEADDPDYVIHSIRDLIPLVKELAVP